MLPNYFVGRRTKPTNDALSEALGSVRKLWDKLLRELATQQNIAKYEWSSYSPKAGWSLKVLDGQRTILYLSPCKHSFRASFALGQAAVKAALESSLPPTMKKSIREAKTYAEGTAVRIEVKSQRDIDAVLTVTAAKHAN